MYIPLCFTSLWNLCNPCNPPLCCIAVNPWGWHCLLTSGSYYQIDIIYQLLSFNYYLFDNIIITRYSSFVKENITRESPVNHLQTLRGNHMGIPYRIKYVIKAAFAYWHTSIHRPARCVWLRSFWSKKGLCPVKADRDQAFLKSRTSPQRWRMTYRRHNVFSAYTSKSSEWKLL